MSEPTSRPGHFIMPPWEWRGALRIVAPFRPVEQPDADGDVLLANAVLEGDHSCKVTIIVNRNISAAEASRLLLKASEWLAEEPGLFDLGKRVE